MKKFVAISLAVLVVFLAFGCSESTTATSSDTAAASTAESSSAEVSESASASEDGSSAGVMDGKTIAYFAITMSNQWLQNMETAMKDIGATEGFEVVTADANFSADTQLSQVDTLLNDGIDGASVFVADEGSGTAVVEKFRNANVPVIGESLRLMDADGNLVAPVVELDAVGCGEKCAEWVAENYMNYDYDFSDMSTVGVLLDTRSTYQSDVRRSDGFKDKLVSAMPEIPEANYYTADCAAEANASDDAEASYNQVAAVIGGHPEITTWIIFSSVDDYAIGAARAVQAAGAEDKVLITSCGGERAVQEWANGDSPCWKSTCYYDANTFATQVIDGLSQMIGGTAPEDLWPDHIEEGQTYANYKITGTMATPDTYEEIMANGGQS